MNDDRPHVRVTVDGQALPAARGARGARGWAGGQFGWAGPIMPETARRPPCDASVSRMITGPDGLPLDVGRAQRTATAAIRRSVELRDGTCVCADCSALPEWCDVRHVIHWAFGCPTNCDNGALLCKRHHTAVHEGGFDVARDPAPAGGTPTAPTAPRSATHTPPAAVTPRRGAIANA